MAFVDINFESFLIRDNVISAEGWIYSDDSAPKWVCLQLSNPNSNEVKQTEVLLGDSFNLTDNLRPNAKLKTAFFLFGTINISKNQQVELLFNYLDKSTTSLILPKSNIELNYFKIKRGILRTTQYLFSIIWYKQQIKKWLDPKQMLPKTGLSNRPIGAFDLQKIISGIELDLIFDHSLGGGANYFRDCLIEEKLGKNHIVGLISYDLHLLTYTFKLYQPNFEIKETHSHSFAQIEKILAECFIREFYVNCLVSQPRPDEIIDFTISYVQKHSSKVILAVHDFFMICPSFNLLDSKGQFCDIPEINFCQQCLPNQLGAMTNLVATRNIEKWRETWSNLMLNVSAIHCFSNSSLQIFSKAFPKFKHLVQVIPHKVNPLRKVNLNKSQLENRLIIGVVGNITYCKGAEVVRSIYNKIMEDKLPVKIVVVGNINGVFDEEILVQTGKYKVDDLPSYLEQYKIDMVLMPSIWPETFSYVCHELMATGIPLVVFDLGAQKDLAAQYIHGYYVSLSQPEKVLDSIIEIFDKNYKAILN